MSDSITVDCGTIDDKHISILRTDCELHIAFQNPWNEYSIMNRHSTPLYKNQFAQYRTYRVDEQYVKYTKQYKTYEFEVGKKYFNKWTILSIEYDKYNQLIVNAITDQGVICNIDVQVTNPWTNEKGYKQDVKLKEKCFKYITNVKNCPAKLFVNSSGKLLTYTCEYNKRSDYFHGSTESYTLAAVDKVIHTSASEVHTIKQHKIAIPHIKSFLRKKYTVVDDIQYATNVWGHTQYFEAHEEIVIREQKYSKLVGRLV